MTDFDALLRERLLRLDGAIPEPAPIRVPSGRRALGRRRRGIALSAATVVLLLGAAVGVAAQLREDERAAEIAAQARMRVDTENRLNGALTPLFPDDECVSLEEGMRRTRAALDASGFRTWQILWDGDLVDGGCATFSFSLDNTPEAVELVPRDAGAGYP
jgi:hypothetical protein